MSTSIKVPSLKLAKSRLKKLETLANFLTKIRWKNKLPAPEGVSEFVGREVGRQRTLIKAITKKKAILEDQYGYEGDF